MEMIKRIIRIVLRNRRNYDNMTVEIICLLSQYSSVAKRAKWFMYLDERYERQEMSTFENGLTYTWKEW